MREDRDLGLIIDHRLRGKCVQTNTDKDQWKYSDPLFHYTSLQVSLPLKMLLKYEVLNAEEYPLLRLHFYILLDYYY